MNAPDLVAALLTAAAVAALSAVLRPPTPRLAPRVRPYAAAARSSLGHGADVEAVAEGAVLSPGTLRQLLEPIVGRLARGLAGITDRDGEEHLALRLRQSGLFPGVPADRRISEYRVRQLVSAGGWATGGAVVGAVLGRGAGVALVLTCLGFVVGVTRLRGRVDAAIAARRERMRVELYTFNQLLAIHVQVGGGVVQALQRLADRGSGAVVEEVAEALRLHRSGRRLSDVLTSAAAGTPEPHAARTYRLLASGAELGTDLAAGLRLLSEDIRGDRVEALRRAATKRRAAMLVPIIGLLAPVMLLFVAAPLPSIVFGGQ